MNRKLYERVMSLVLASVMLFACGCGKKNETPVTSDIAVTTETTVDNAEEADGYALDVAAGELVVDDVSFSSTFTTSNENNNRVFYEIFVGSFSDSNGDGIGDLKGIINRMDYLNDGNPQSGKSLGVEGIWLSPIFESPSYHKYDVADYFSIDDEFGTMDDLKELVNLCHERGVKVIIDLPINHTSSRNNLFKQFCTAHKEGDTENEYYDFYTYSELGETGRTFYKIASTDEKYEGNFSSDMPELNFDNEAVREYVLKVAEYYLEDIGLDGFRFDAAKYLYYGEETKNVEFWEWYMTELRKIKPDMYAVAEVWDSDSLTQKYATALNCFDFTMSQADGLISSTTKKGDVNKYCSYVEKYLNTVSALNENVTIVPFISNHDMDRASGYMMPLNYFAQVAANIYILGPGSPFIYYGEEIGIKGSRGGANTDANRRLAMLWGDGDTITNPVGSDYDENNQISDTVADQKADANSLYSYYKRLIMIRQANPEIALGSYKALSFSDTKVGGFVSTYEGTSVCVIHNTTGNEVTIDLKEATDIDFSGINAVIGYGNATLEGSKLTVSEQTSVVLR